MEKGAQSFHALSGVPPLRNLHVFSYQQVLKTCPFGFSWRLHYIGMIDLALDISDQLNPQSCSPGGGALSSDPLSMGLFLLQVAPHPVVTH
jgi:hypothetical protein